MHDFMTYTMRRHLLARIRILALGGIVAPAPGGRPSNETDVSLLGACGAFAELESAKLRLFYGPGRVSDDDEREEQISPFLAAQVKRLGVICSCPARSSAGLRAKAATWQLWDGGELFQRATRHGLLEDRLLVSIFQDMETAA